MTAPPDPPRPGDAGQTGPYETLNVLVIGSDSRGGGEARADTLVLTHLPADRKRVTSVSLPRDLLVEITACRSPSGKSVPSRRGPLNWAVIIGGRSCARQTVESVTGVRVDHVVEIDFSGFKGMVNALGGVKVQLSKPVDDPKSGLRLPAGRHRLQGDQALAYVRSRYAFDGSDLGRIKRQQWFMAAMLEQARTQLSSPVRLTRFLTIVGKSIKTDAGLNLPALLSIARSLDKTTPGMVRFLTVPVRPAPADPNRLVLKQPSAGRLFTELRG